MTVFTNQEFQDWFNELNQDAAQSWGFYSEYLDGDPTYEDWLEYLDNPEYFEWLDYYISLGPEHQESTNNFDLTESREISRHRQYVDYYLFIDTTRADKTGCTFTRSVALTSRTIENLLEALIFEPQRFEPDLCGS